MTNGRCKYLVVATSDNVDSAELMDVMRSFALYIKIRSNSMEGHQEISFEICSKSEMNLECVQRLSACNGVRTTNWVAESGENVG